VLCSWRSVTRRLALAAVIAGSPAARADRSDDAGETAWHTYAAFRNDVFTELLPPIDDRGFTHDNVFSLRRQQGALSFGGGFVHRWITSTRDRRRWDQLDVVATGEQTLDHGVTLGLRIGPTLAGNFGGRYLQNGWHTLTGSGPTLAEGLADDYPSRREVGALLGARARVTRGRDRVQAWAVLDGQIAAGRTGVTAIESAAGGSASVGAVGLHAELAVTRYHATDPYLRLPGGYGVGWQLEWRAGVHVAWSRFRITYQYRANEGGSGEPIGVIAFQSRR
jgi:hypothetical protein